MQSAWARKYKKVFNLLFKKKFFSFSSASLLTAKKFRQPKLFNTPSFNHWRPLKFGKRPMEQRVSSQMATNFQNIGGRPPNIQRYLRKHHVGQKFQANFFGKSFFPVFRWGLWNFCRETYRRVGDISVWRKFTEVVTNLAKKRTKMSLELSQKKKIE